MKEVEIIELIKKLDTTNTVEQERYWSEIKELNIDLPKYFLLSYPRFKKWQGRVHLVFHCIKYARKSESAFELGIEALSDKATLVRYRGASLLAYSLRKDAIPHLKKNLGHHDIDTRNDAKRAIKAIKKQNHHLFMEGRATTWNVNQDDDDTGKDISRSLINRIKKLIKV